MAWLVGAGIQLVGGVVINLATVLMKLGHNRRSEACAMGRIKPIYKYWQWLVGTILFAVGNLCNFVSYAFASQALLTALGSVQFVSNVVFSWLLLGERIRLRVLLVTAIIVAGNILVVLFASKSDPSYTSLELRQLYLSTQFSIYLLAVAAGVPTLYVISNYGVKMMARRGTRTPAIWLKLTPVAYCVCSSLIGAQAVLFSTSVAILARKSLEGDNQLDNWFAAVLFGGFAVCAVVWVSRLDQGLRYFDAAIIIPMLQIVWILLIMVSGNLYFQEFNKFSNLQLAMFCVGLGLMLLGIYGLAPSAQQRASRASSSKSSLMAGGDGPPIEDDNAAVADELLGPEWWGHGQQPASPLPPATVPPLCLLPALGQLDVGGIAGLPLERLVAAQHHLQHLPRTQQEARQLETSIAQLAWQLGHQQRQLLAAQQELTAWHARQQLRLRANPAFDLLGNAGQGPPLERADAVAVVELAGGEGKAQPPQAQASSAASPRAVASLAGMVVSSQLAEAPVQAGAEPKLSEVDLQALARLPNVELLETLLRLPDDELTVVLLELQRLPQTEEGERELQAIFEHLERRQQRQAQQVGMRPQQPLQQQQRDEGTRGSCVGADGQRAKSLNSNLLGPVAQETARGMVPGLPAATTAASNGGVGTSPSSDQKLLLALMRLSGKELSAVLCELQRLPRTAGGASQLEAILEHLQCRQRQQGQKQAGPEVVAALGGAMQQQQAQQGDVRPQLPQEAAAEDLRPRHRSSIARLAIAAKGAAMAAAGGLQQSVAKAAGLLAGMGQSNQLPAASPFSVPMLTSDTRPLALTATTNLIHQQQALAAQQLQLLSLLSNQSSGQPQP